MPQTFYIEADEEIISVIGRLRKSSEEENIFVFPKRALVLQSIVNLRLFQREAQKLGKKIVIVSQDEVGKMLASKAGIETENYSEDFSQKASHLELTARENIPEASAPVRPMPAVPRSDAIGSADFYASAPAAGSAFGKESEALPRPSEKKTLPVRNASPARLTSLNSKRFEAVAPLNNTIQTPPRASAATPSASQIPLSSAAAFASSSGNTPQPERGERLKNFYNGTRSAVPAAPPIPPAPQAPPHLSTSIAGKKAHTIFFALGGISLLSLVLVALFLFLPKAEVHVTPYKIMQTADIELAGSAAASPSDENAVAVRLLKKEIEAAVTIATTGKSGGVNQKAHGTAIIYNRYSATPQPLVATTRLETADGKLFRLVSGVTVPGMTTTGGKQEPGVIEVSVIADQTGEAYNVEPTTFTIPGFKGSPKYAGFSAASTKAMTGGGSGGAADVSVVAKVDLDTAIREAKAKAKEDFLSAIQGELLPGEKVLDEQVDIVPLTPDALPQVGTVANAFDYKNTFALRAFVFSEKTVQEKVGQRSEQEAQGIRFKPMSSSITYSESIANFSDETLRLKAHALVTMESDIDRDKLQAALLGRNESGIKQALEGFPEVKKIEVVFRPQWFVQSIPDDQDRVFILVEPGEEG